MAVKMGSSSLSCIATSLSSPYRRRRKPEMSYLDGHYDCKHSEWKFQRDAQVNSCQSVRKLPNNYGRSSKRQYIPFAASKDQLSYNKVNPDASDIAKHHPSTEDISHVTTSNFLFGGTAGKPGLISFYTSPYIKGDKLLLSGSQRNQSSLLWFVGPIVLVASFIFPSLYLRRILTGIFEDSLLTDFLILFFTEALFYCGVAVFVLLIDHLWRLDDQASSSYIVGRSPPLAYRISSVATLVLSLIIPMVTMGLVWPWTGPAASATLAPYLVGIVVQFAFERYAKYLKSPSWPVIPVIFQIYRLHQLNRAAQLVTALSFTVRGAEMTSQNLAINNSLSTLLNVLQLLGVICVWSLSSFLMRYLPSSALSEL